MTIAKQWPERALKAEAEVERLRKQVKMDQAENKRLREMVERLQRRAEDDQKVIEGLCRERNQHEAEVERQHKELVVASMENGRLREAHRHEADSALARGLEVTRLRAENEELRGVDLEERERFLRIEEAARAYFASGGNAIEGDALRAALEEK